MSWGRIDDRMPEHRKWAALEATHGARVWADSMAVWVCVLCHANRNETDGKIPRVTLSRLTPLDAKAAFRAADAMCSVGLMDPVEDGYAIHDFTKYNPSHAEKQKAREAEAARGRRRRGTASTADDGGSSGVASDAESAPRPPWTPDGQTLESTLSRPVPSQREEERESEAGASASSEFALAPADGEPKRKRKPRVAASTDPAIVEVFEHWRTAFGKTEGAILDANRAARIRWAIGAYGIETAKRAIDGCAANPWNRGVNPSGKRYDDLTLIFRDASKTEGYAADAPVAGRPAAGPVRNIATSDTVDVDAIARRIAENNARVRSA